MKNRLRVRPVAAVIALAALVAGVPSAAFAQRTTTGTVIGKIVDSSGAVLPGVSVQLTSPDALGQFSGVTDGQGTYRVTNLPPAEYEVRAELSGFGTVIRKAPVRLNAVTEVDFTLSVGTVAETVNVTAETPIVDPERAGLSVNINNQALTSVPVTTNRRFRWRGRTRLPSLRPPACGGG
ncbi:MAG TPA: carboxypeptidase-like regulatory domain-containing protein [Vicinamibacterales bacterium]|nr:carboxypeptidase-like regulatory domain-containing protein [Vicinamibacterales bacterium]